MTYAKNTTVSVERSKAEIERTLQRYDADAFGVFNERHRALLQFQISNRMVQIELPLPDRDDPEFTHSQRGAREPHVAAQHWEKACRQRWRALALVVKAKLEAVASGISTVEQEFLAWTVLPGGRTVSQQLLPHIERALEHNEPLRLTRGDS